MPSTHLSLHYHVVFSTKNRHSWIEPDWRDDLHRYLGGCITQAEHHQKRRFEDEYLDLLKKHEIDFDERFLW